MRKIFSRRYRFSCLFHRSYDRHLSAPAIDPYYDGEVPPPAGDPYYNYDRYEKYYASRPSDPEFPGQRLVFKHSLKKENICFLHLF